MSPRQLARQLGEYGIKSQNLCIGNARPKGYRKEQFEDVFIRYLTPPSSDTPHLSAHPLRNGENPSGQPVSEVADYPRHSGSGNLSATDNSLKKQESSGVADKTGVSGTVEVEI